MRIITVQAITIILFLLIEPSSMAFTIMILIKNQKIILSDSLFNFEIDNHDNLYDKKRIFDDIDKTRNKTIVINRTIGFRKVRYWEHIIDQKFYVINDSILLHICPNTNKVLYYRKSWTDIRIDLSIYNNISYNPKNHSWMRFIIFPDEKDCKNIYRFDQNQSYPIIGLEIRYKDGDTKIYNHLGEQIGVGIPTPSFQSFSISGFDKGSQQDPWRLWRENANYWFRSSNYFLFTNSILLVQKILQKKIVLLILCGFNCSKYWLVY